VQIPVSWKKIRSAELTAIHGVAFDIDDTFSTEGKITSEAYHSLWMLKEKGFSLVAVTGRPAGWCDHIARFWPVDAVVGENGAFSFFMKDGKLCRIDTPRADGMKPQQAEKKLAELSRHLKKKFPGLKFASDQRYRENDLAIDFCEDVKPWSKAKVMSLVEECRAAGAHAKISSIHVNTWFGDFDKKAGFAHLLKSKKVKIPSDKKNWIYLGDSPNDEPLFQWFNVSVGVANLREFLPLLSHPPTFLTRQSSGRGFAEVAQVLVRARN
jgi:HAD superfamily hydrolase (TIGR01484 family)